MKTNTILGALLTVLFIVSCNNKESTTTLEEIQGTSQVSAEQTETNTFITDSIAQVNRQIDALRNSQFSKKEEIAFLSKQQDSIKNALNQIEQSLAQVNAKKIAPGINGVNTKLDELKGQRENLIEQQDLKKREVALAEKRLALLSEEKIVYDAQRKGLYDKGAAPEAFTGVDSLLSGINAKINVQNKAIKTLSRSIDDIDEQRDYIDAQRSSMSSKIRDNYSAKQIFEDFSKEEKGRLEEKLSGIETALANILKDDKELNNTLALHTSKKNAFETEKSMLNEKNANSELLDNASENNSKKTYAIIGVGSLAFILLLFYLVGKARKRKINY